MVLSRGFSIVATIIVIALLILIAGSGYFYFNSESIVTNLGVDDPLQRDVEKIKSIIEDQDVKTVSDFLYQTLDGQLVGADTEVIGVKSDNSTKVIGVVKALQDPSCPNCFQISSGGETVFVKYEQSTTSNSVTGSGQSDIKTGDVVIVNIYGTENVDDSDNDQFVVNDIEEVTIESHNSGSNDSDSGNSDGENIGDNDPSGGSSTAGQSGKKSKYDVDNSGLNIQILSDF